jgi:hypothetical protein
MIMKVFWCDSLHLNASSFVHQKCKWKHLKNLIGQYEVPIKY